MGQIDSGSKSSRLLASRRYTHNTLTTAQESFTNVLDLQASEIYTQANKIPSSGLPYSGSSQNASYYTVGSDNILKYWYRQKLTKSNTNNEVWFFLDPSGSDSGIGAQLINDNQEVNFVSPKYSVASLATSTAEDSTPGYLAVLYKSTSATSGSLSGDDVVSTNDYQFDYKTGIVQFMNANVDPSNSEYVFMTVYQYVGKTLATGVEISGNVSASVSSTGSFGYLNVDGDAVIGGNLTFGDADTDSVSFSAEVNSNIIPDADSTYDLGSSSKNWRQLSITHVTASGHISGSSTSTGSLGYLNVDGQAIIKGMTNSNLVNVSSSYSTRVSNLKTDSGSFSTRITAATSSISALKTDSGSFSTRVTDNNATGSILAGTGNIQGLGTTNNVQFNSITSSGEISASGRVYVNNSFPQLKLSDDGYTDHAKIGLLGDSIYLQGSDTSIGVRLRRSDNFDIARFVMNTETTEISGSGGLYVKSHITASGNISASGNLYLSGTADIDGNVDIDNTTTTIDSSDAISLDAGAASNFTTTAGALTLDGKTGVDIKEDGDSVITIDTNQDTLFASVGGSTSDPDVEFDGYVRHDGQVEVADSTDSTSITTGALVVDGGVGIAKDLVVGGMVTAQEFHSEFVSASIMYISGSNKFGDTEDDNHSFTGSINQSGSFNLNDGNMTITDTLTATNIGAFTSTGAIDFDSQNMTNVDIDSGTIDGTTIGVSSHNTIKGTTIDATTDFTIDGLVLTADTITNDAALSIVASSGDITLDPAGNNVLPGGDSEDDLGVSGTAWRALYVDSIEMNGQGAIAGATHITASGNISSSGDIFSSGNLDIDGTANIAGNITLQSDLSVVDINASGNITGSSVSASSGDFSAINIDGGTVDGITSLTAGSNLDIGAYDLRAATITADGLTSGRVTFATTNGQLTDDSDLTFSGATLSATYVNATHITGSGNLKVAGNISGSVSTTGSFGRIDTAGSIYANGRIYEAETSVVDHATAMAIVFGG
jgi:cytoskeletal protein CcmA (bactofilin family)